MDRVINKIEDKNSEEIKYKLIRSFVGYVTSDLESDKNNALFNRFKMYLNQFDSKQPGIEIFNVLTKFSQWYKYFKNNEWENNKFFKGPLTTICEQFETFIILLIRIFEQNSSMENEKVIFDDKQVKEIEKCLLIIESFIYRRKFCSLPSKILTRRTPKILVNFDRNFTTSENLYYQMFIEPNEGESDKEYRMPKDLEMLEGMKNLNVYKNDRKTTKNFLFRLGTFIAKEKFSIDDYSIEHILPQDFSKWNIKEEKDIENIELKIHTIGNLTLTSYNSEYSNETFKLKISEMKKKGNFPLNKYFINKFDENNCNWDPKEIEQRAIELFKISKKIWNFDELENKFNINNFKIKNLTTSKERNRF